jgi:hypothetical protein
MAISLTDTKPAIPGQQTLSALGQVVPPLVGLGVVSAANTLLANTDASTSNNQQSSSPDSGTPKPTVDYSGTIGAMATAVVAPLVALDVMVAEGLKPLPYNALAIPGVSGNQPAPAAPGQPAPIAKAQPAAPLPQSAKAKFASAPAPAPAAMPIVVAPIATQENLPVPATHASAPAPTSPAEPDAVPGTQPAPAAKQQLTLADEHAGPEAAHAADVNFHTGPVPTKLDQKMAHLLHLDPSQMATLSVQSPANYAMLAAKLDKFVNSPAAKFDQNHALTPASLQAFTRDTGARIALSHLPQPPSVAMAAAVPGGPSKDPPSHEEDPSKGPKTAAEGPKGKGNERVVHNEIKAHHSSTGTNFTVVTRSQDNPDRSHEVKFTEAHSMPDHKPGRDRQLPATGFRNNHKSMIATAGEPGPGGPAKAPQQMASNSPSVSHGGTIGFMGPLTAGIKNPGPGMT